VITNRRLCSVLETVQNPVHDDVGQVVLLPGYMFNADITQFVDQFSRLMEEWNEFFIPHTVVALHVSNE